MATIAVWFRHPKTGYVVLVTHEDTRDRCLSEGWTITSDPRLPAPVSLSTPEPAPDTEPAAAPVAAGAPAQGAQPSVAGHTDDMSVIGDSPEELAAQLEAADLARVQAIRERNTAARTVFGIETPTPSAPSVKPAKTGQKPGGSRYAG